MKGLLKFGQLQNGPPLTSRCRGVLIIDDEPDIRESIRECIALEEYAACVASQGEEGLRILSQLEMPQLILLDLMMPVMDGWAFAENFQANPRFRECPIIIISAFAEKGNSIPHYAVLRKPLDIDHLMVYVDKLVVKKGDIHELL